MNKATFDDYIERFNNEDTTAFDRYLAPNMAILNGGLQLNGIQGMKDHYQQRIWPYFIETIHVEQFVSDDENLAVRMWTNFKAKHDADDTLFGAVQKGDQFDFRGVIMYRLKNGLFTHIWVAYNSFTNTKIDGSVVNLGLPH